MWHSQAFKIVGNFILALIICLSITAIPANKSVHAATIVVNSTADLADYDPLDGYCNTESNTGDGNCTLRAAIQTAYQFDTIDFDSSLNGSTIYIAYALESLEMNMDDVILDGEGHSITISGEYMSHVPGADMECLRIAGNRNTIQYLTIRDCPSWGIMVGEGDYGDDNIIYGVTLLGNGSGGISFNEDDGDGLGGNHNTVDFSYIGSSTSNPTSCIVSESNSTGVALGHWVHGNHIEHSNILCNAFDGINSDDSDTNYIYGNVIAGNGMDGIYLGSGSSYTTIKGNYIGTLTGADTFGNAYNGIKIDGGSHNITIGGSTTADANIIGGNAQSGIFITGASSAITINNNIIGIVGSLNSELPNGNAGIAIIDNSIDTASGSAINIGDAAYETSRQYISGNAREGLYILNSNNINIKVTNQIGRGDFTVNPDIAMGNGLEGVRIINSSHVTVSAWAVVYNGAAGIALEGESSLYNILMPLMVHSNGGLPIDLGNDGHTANDLNDSDAGPNTLLNYPELTGVSGGVAYGYTCYPDCSVYIFQALDDPSEPGGGYIDLNGAIVDASDTTGYWEIAVPLNGHPIQYFTLMTMHVPTGMTSELSPRPQFFIPLIKKP